MEPKIIFEDAQMLVLDKPAGLMVHPALHHAPEPTLEDWLKEKYPAQGDVPGFYLVHRLDADTSGVIAVARTEAAFAYLKAQFKNRETRKTYCAFLYGALKDDRGVIDKPIGSARGGLAPGRRDRRNRLVARGVRTPRPRSRTRKSVLHRVAGERASRRSRRIEGGRRRAQIFLGEHAGIRHCRCL